MRLKLPVYREEDKRGPPILGYQYFVLLLGYDENHFSNPDLSLSLPEYRPLSLEWGNYLCSMYTEMNSLHVWYYLRQVAIGR